MSTAGIMMMKQTYPIISAFTYCITEWLCIICFGGNIIAVWIMFTDNILFLVCEVLCSCLLRECCCKVMTMGCVLNPKCR